MKKRDSRLKQARANSERVQRELKRDRDELDRREKVLLRQIRVYAQKGDLVKAKMVAQQVANFRTIADKNFASAMNIANRAQVRLHSPWLAANSVGHVVYPSCSPSRGRSHACEPPI